MIIRVLLRPIFCILEVCWLKEKSGAVNISYLFDLEDIGMGKTTADSAQELMWL